MTRVRLRAAPGSGAVPSLPAHRARDVSASILAAVQEQCPALVPTSELGTFHLVTVEALGALDGIDERRAHALATAVASLATQMCSGPSRTVASSAQATRAALLVVLTAPEGNPVWQALDVLSAAHHRAQAALAAPVIGRRRRERAWQRFAEAERRQGTLDVRPFSRAWVDRALEHLAAIGGVED